MSKTCQPYHHYKDQAGRLPNVLMTLAKCNAIICGHKFSLMCLKSVTGYSFGVVAPCVGSGIAWLLPCGKCTESSTP